MAPKSKALLASQRSPKPPDAKRSASATSLHPLTRQHNQSLARSTGSLFEQHDEVRFEGIGCRCRVCRSPRGAWRKDSLGYEIDCELERFKPTQFEDTDVEDIVSPKTSPKRRIHPTPSTKIRSAESFCLEADFFEASSMRVRPRTIRPATASAKSVTADSDRILDDETLSVLRRTARPSSAPSGGRDKQKTGRDLRIEAAQERKRLLNEGFIERCRMAWDAKVAFCESRQKQAVAYASAAMEAKKFAAKAKSDMEERARQWIAIVRLIAVLQYFHELAVSGRIFHFASLGGKRLQQAMKWGRLSVEHQNKLVAAETKPMVCQKLRVAYMISSIFPSVRCLCAKGPLVLDDTEAGQQLEREIHTKIRNWSLWSTVCSGALAIARLKMRCKLRRAGKTIAIVLSQMMVTNTIYVSMRNRFLQIRLLQAAVRQWIKRERKRRVLLAALLLRIENDTLKSRWADEDIRILREERARLANLRTVKERKIAERIISLARERYRQYMHPRTDLDFADLNQRLETHRVPTFVRDLCTYNIYIERKVLIKRTLDDQTRRFEAYEREKRCWDDIEEAVRIIDPTGRNPDPVPEPPPPLPLFHFTVEEATAASIVLNAGAWCEQYQDIVDASKEEVRNGCIRSLDFFKNRETIRRLPSNLSQIHVAMRSIVKSALFSTD